MIKQIFILIYNNNKIVIIVIIIDRDYNKKQFN